MVIAGGKILSDGTLGELRARVSRERWLTVDLDDDSAAAFADPDARVISREGHRVRLAFDPQVVTPTALIQRVAGRYPVKDLFVENPPIETLIARLYQEARGS
jgi:ABC-2 type transport system ATP-binding protein